MVVTTSANRRPCLAPSLLLQLVLVVFQSSLPSLASASSSSSTASAPGGFTAKGELPQMEFARLGAYRFASPSVCVRTRQACYVLCARPERNPLREEVDLCRSSTGSGIHLVSPGIGCLCQGQDGDVLAQLGLMRREAERYLHTFGHPISARGLAQRLGAILGGKGQETWSRPPCCISVIMSSSGGSFSSSPAAAGAGAGAAGAGAAAAAAPSSSLKGKLRRNWQEAEMYQVDPTGLVLGIRGQVFGGGQVDDPVAHKLQEWLAREELFVRPEKKEEEGEEEEEEEEVVIWAKLWEGMQKHFPALARHPERVECAKAAGSSFRRVGRLDQVLLLRSSSSSRKE